MAAAQGVEPRLQRQHPRVSPVRRGDRGIFRSAERGDDRQVEARRPVADDDGGAEVSLAADERNLPAVHHVGGVARQRRGNAEVGAGTSAQVALSSASWSLNVVKPMSLAPT